jgi:hypothetical protein
VQGDFNLQGWGGGKKPLISIFHDPKGIRVLEIQHFLGPETYYPLCDLGWSGEGQKVKTKTKNLKTQTTP